MPRRRGLGATEYAEAMQYCNGDPSKAYSASVQRVDDGEALRSHLIAYRGLHDRLLGKWITRSHSHTAPS